MDLGEFLLARVTEDEAVARAAANAESGEMYEARLVGAEWVSRRGMVCAATDSDIKLWDNEGADSLEMAPPVANHVARHDPAHVLADCGIKRVIAALHRRDDWWGTCVSCAHDGDDSDEGYVHDRYPCLTLRALALPYALHPDYRPEWAPEVLV